MKRRISVLLMVVLVAVSGFLAVQLFAEDSPTETIHWQNDLDAARRVSQRKDKPMLLVISADWCHHCRKLEQNTLIDPGVADHVNASFIPVHLDFDRNKRIAKILEVQSIPCTIVLSPRADLLGRIVGHVEPAKFQKALQAARRLQERINPASRAVRSNIP